MKTILRGVLTTLLLSLAIASSFGQKGIDDGSKYGKGEDSVRCITNLSLYREYVKQNNFAPAIGPWQIVYSECPKCSKYIYIDGVKMITDALDKETDASKKGILLDSLMDMYDARIKYFGQEGFVLGKKGLDYLKYSENTTENMKKGYDLLKRSIELIRFESGPNELVTFMQKSNELFNLNSLEGTQVIIDYSTCADIISHELSKKPDPNMQKAKETIDQIFETSPAVKCENLIELYTKKFAETPEDKAFLLNATNLMSAKKCVESDIFYKMGSKLIKIEPTANLAYDLAVCTRSKEKLEESSVFFNQAIDLQSDQLLKAKYYLELSDVTRRIGNYQLARTYALNAIENDPTNGYPYMLIGYIYAVAGKTCSEDEFEQKTVLWAVVDKFAKAKSVDPNLTDEANKAIDDYKPHFPDNESIFFYGLKVGDSYTIKCWINEVTTVRSR